MCTWFLTFRLHLRLTDIICQESAILLSCCNCSTSVCGCILWFHIPIVAYIHTSKWKIMNSSSLILIQVEWMGGGWVWFNGCGCGWLEGMVQISLNVILFSLSLSLVNLGGVPSTGSHSSRVPASAINSSTGVAPAVNPFAHLVSHDPYPILFESCVCVCVCVCVW